MPNHSSNRHILMTDGAGFIGVNSARYFAERGWRVTVLDNLSRRPTADNLQWLHKQADVSCQR
jgi:CDP-paratose 2-epimerase